MKKTKFRERFEVIRRSTESVRPEHAEMQYRLLKNMGAIGTGITKKTYGAMLEKSGSTFKGIMEVIIYDRMKFEGKTKLENYLSTDKGPLGHRKIEIKPNSDGGLTFGLARKKHKLFNPNNVTLINNPRTANLVKQVAFFRSELNKRIKGDIKAYGKFMNEFGKFEQKVEGIKLKVDQIINDVIEGSVDWEESDSDFSWQYNDTMGFFFVPEGDGLMYDNVKNKFYRENVQIDRHDPSKGTETRYYNTEDIHVNDNFIQNSENYVKRFRDLNKEIDKLSTDPKLSSLGEYINKEWGNDPKKSFIDVMEQVQASVVVFEEMVIKYTVDYVGEVRSASEFGELTSECVIDLNSAKQNVIKSLNASLNDYEDLKDDLTHDPFTIADRGK